MTEQKKLIAFEAAYEKLCIEHGYTHNFTPELLARDDGSFSIVMKKYYRRIEAENGTMQPDTA